MAGGTSKAVDIFIRGSRSSRRLKRWLSSAGVYFFAEADVFGIPGCPTSQHQTPDLKVASSGKYFLVDGVFSVLPRSKPDGIIFASKSFLQTPPFVPTHYRSHPQAEFRLYPQF